MSSMNLICVLLFCANLFAACGSKVSIDAHSKVNDVTGGARPQPPPAPSEYEYPGLVPLDAKRPPATDLTDEGQLLSPEAAERLRAGGADLSMLNPREDTDLWRNKLGGPLNPDDDALEIGNNDSVTFEGFLTNVSNTGNARFGARIESNGKNKSFTLSVGKRIHDVLLRKSLLRKLGYQIAPAVHLTQVRVRFSSVREVEIFRRRVSEDTVADSARWIVGQPDPLTLVVQDLVAVDAQLSKYNLANGRIAGRTGGRRILRALLIPFSLVSMGENANIFPWVPGRIFDRHVLLNYDNAEDFDCSREDALWILRRISSLTRQDFTEIVNSAALPSEVSQLLIEKLIARRNAMMKLFSLSTAELSFDPKISSGERLLNGQIVGENFDGHGERFSYGDPQSPFSQAEIASFIKSKFISSAIANGVQYINRFLPNTDISGEILKKKLQSVNQALKTYQQTGTLNDVPLGAFVIPTLGSQLLLSRDVVIGSYMGIDHKVSLADTIGVNLNAGAFVGIDGLPSSVAVSGGAQAFYRRTFTHLKPISSVKSALKTPFRNMIIPMFMEQIADSFSSLDEVTLSQSEPSARQQKISEAVSRLKEQLSVGESLIITDSLGGEISAQASRNFYEIVDLYGGAAANRIVLSRIHILRISEDTIIISDGRGIVSSVRLHAGINAAFVPVVRIGISVSQGQAETEVIPLNLDSDERRNPKILATMSALSAALRQSSTSAARRIHAGYTLKHSFRDNKMNESLLFGRFAQINGAMSVEVRDNASGASRTFYQRRLSQRWGTDFQSFVLDGITGILQGFSKIDLALRAPADEPSATIGGKSFLREFVYEGVVEPASEQSDISRIKDGLFSMQYRWRGWSMERPELTRIIEQINDKYSFEFYPDTVLGNTTSIQFYDISARTLIHPEGLRALVRHDQQYFRTMFEKYLNRRVIPGGCDLSSNTHRDEFCRAFSQFLWFKGRYGGEWARGNHEVASSHLIQAISSVENILEPEDLIAILGGAENVFIISRIDGFRAGDENGDVALAGNTFGRLGTLNPSGRLTQLSKTLSIPVSELMASWIRESL